MKSFPTWVELQMSSTPRWAISAEELESKAVKFWPAGIIKQAAEIDVIPLLLKTQQDFLSILILSKRPDHWKQILTSSDLPGNLFLKHLQVLANIGGETLKRISSNIESIFPNDTVTYKWRGKDYRCELRSLRSVRSFNNKVLSIDAAGLRKEVELDDLGLDVATLLMHGATFLHPSAIPEKIADDMCIGGLLGDQDSLSDFVTRRYIQVSRITGGANANAQGQFVQKYVSSFLSEHLPDALIEQNSTVPGVSQNAGLTDTNFDIVVHIGSVYIAIEVSFQQTTNSTIERKGGQAVSRAEAIRSAGAYIAYVIDGAGNFERRAALNAICTHSDCTVAFTDSELERLVAFIKEMYIDSSS